MASPPLDAISAKRDGKVLSSRFVYHIQSDAFRPLSPTDFLSTGTALLKQQISIYAVRWRTPIRITASVIGLFVCGWLTVGAAKIGVSRLLSDYGMRANLPVAANRAVSYGNSDPEVRYTRAVLFTGTGEFTAAARELEQTIVLRPRDHNLWVELGLARDQAGEAESAIAALKESTRLAPYYAQPRWQLGNLLIRKGRYDEAFAELRGAVASNPTLLPNAIDLAYGLYGGDAAAVERTIQPQTASARFTLARFFARNGKAEDALRLFRVSGRVSDADRQKLLAELFAARQFPAAYEVWANNPDGTRQSNLFSGRASMIDASFEEDIRTGASTTFGWRIDRDQRAVKASLNTNEPHTGARSLLLEWSGDPQPSTAVVSQLVLVSPKKAYRLSFWVRTEDLVTAGSPIITVSEPAETERLLTYSAPLVQSTKDWRRYSLQFETGTDTQAINIAVRREGCTATPCPIFGRIWFDDFVLGNP